MYSGADSFEIRVNVSVTFGHKKLLVFVCDSSGWKGYHYNSYTLLETNADGTQRRYTDRLGIGDDVFMVKELNPLCGWKCFTDSLALFNLDTLPTQILIKNSKLPHGILDGHHYLIEVATRHSYRFLSYYMPEYADNKESRTIADFISFLKRQLGNNYDWPFNNEKNGK